MRQSIHRLMVSRGLYSLAAEAIYAHSLATEKFESINSTVQQAAVDELSETVTPEQVLSLLEATELNGPIKIHLIVTEQWSATFKEALRRLSEAAGRPLSVRECSYLLAARLVSRSKAARKLRKQG